MTIAVRADTFVADGFLEEEPPSQRIRWSTVLLVWAVPTVICMSQSAASYAIRGGALAQWPSILLRGVKVESWALLTPAIFQLGRRLPLVGGRFVRNGIAHLGIALGYGVLSECFWAWCGVVIARTVRPASYLAATVALGPDGVRRNQLTMIFGGTATDLFIYAAVLAVAAAVARDRRSEQLEGLLARAQVQALKMRVHPHFLFNALHAVTVLIKDSPRAATQMVVRLGDLLRASLDRADSAEVTLSSELELLALYLAVEQVRFEDRLTIRYDIAPETRAALIPDLLLQPLVENAVKHGFASGRGCGAIVIAVHREGGQLLVEVSDTGRGWPDTETRGGLGLVLTRERLSALYGAAGSVDLSAQPPIGARVRIRIPFHTSPAR